MVARKFVFPFILLALIVFKVTSATIHIHLHHENDNAHQEHCELCEQAIHHQNLEFSVPTGVHVIQENNVPYFNTQSYSPQNVWVSKFCNKILLVRPPPTLS